MDSQPGFLPAVKCRVARDLSRVFVRAGRRLGLAASWPRACLHLYSRFIAKFSYHSRFFRVAKRIRIRAGGDKFLHSRRYWTALGSQEAGGKGTPKRLRNLADHYLGVGVRTRKVGDSRPGYDHPGHTVFFLQMFEIRERELRPILPMRYFQIPLPGKVREHGDGRRVLFIVSQSAALGKRAEAIVILPGDMHVSGIERKKCRVQRVLARPHESLHPRVTRRATGPFDVIARRELQSLKVEHCERQGDKKRSPA